MKLLNIYYENPIWDDESVDWKSYDLVIPRTTWDYAWKMDKFKAWLKKVSEETKLMNSYELLIGIWTKTISRI